jgi:hypothetical protein
MADELPSAEVKAEWHRNRLFIDGSWVPAQGRQTILVC